MEVKVMKPKAMISQPMGNKTEEEILETRNKAIQVLTDLGYEVVNSYFDFDDDELESKGINKPVFYLAKSIELLSECEACYFCNGYEKARGCRIEYEVADEYGLDIILEKLN